MEIVFPEQNENEFVEVAIRLGYKEIVFAYPENKLPSDIPDVKKLVIKTAILNSKNPDKVRKKADYLISDKNERASLEKSSVDIVFGLEKLGEKDFMKQRDSGLNQVLCKIAVEKKKIYGFNFNDILKAKNKSVVIGRMMQNLTLCRKYKVKTIFFSGAKEPYEMRTINDMESFFGLLSINK